MKPGMFSAIVSLTDFPIWESAYKEVTPIETSLVSMYYIPTNRRQSLATSCHAGYFVVDIGVAWSRHQMLPSVIVATSGRWSETSKPV